MNDSGVIIAPSHVASSAASKVPSNCRVVTLAGIAASSDAQFCAMGGVHSSRMWSGPYGVGNFVKCPMQRGCVSGGDGGGAAERALRTDAPKVHLVRAITPKTELEYSYSRNVKVRVCGHSPVQNPG